MDSLTLTRPTAEGLWALIDIAQERAATSDPHNFESHAMAYERLMRLALDLGVERPRQRGGVTDDNG